VNKNKIESDINRIRLELYEETKNMTTTEHTRWSNERGQKLSEQYGFKIGLPANIANKKNISGGGRTGT